MKLVQFNKAGTPYGYGYTAGETGAVQDVDVTHSTKLAPNGIPLVLAYGFATLAKSGIVREATKAETEAYNSILGIEGKPAFK